MDEKTKKDLKQSVATIAVSVAALAMGVLAIIIAAVNGKVSWVGIIVSAAMLFNIITAYRTRKLILESQKESQEK